MERELQHVDQRPQQALGCRTPAEVFHQVTDVGEEGGGRGQEVSNSPDAGIIGRSSETLA